MELNKFMKDEEENDIVDKNKIEYLTYFINPDMAKGVAKSKDKDNKTRVNDANTQYNNFFDEELKKALMEANISEDSFTELPSSDMVGDPNESEDDFLTRVMNHQFSNENFNQSQLSEIDDEADCQPDNQPPPIFYRQREHQHDAGQYTQNRNKRYKRGSERALGLRICITHDQNRSADNHKSKQRSDVYQLRKNPQR